MSAPTITDRRTLRAKHPGTGLLDTPLEAWAALFRDFMANSEPLSDVVRRHRMRYSAAVEWTRRESWWELRALLRGHSTTDATYVWQKYLAERAHERFARGSTYLAAALTKAPPPNPAARRAPPVDVTAPVVDLVEYRRARSGDA